MTRLKWNTAKRMTQRYAIGYQGPVDGDALQKAVYEFRRQVIDKIEQAKNRPCTDCDGTFPYCCMHFDHRDPTEKVFCISEAVTELKCNMVDLDAEIAKCDVVCANCHAIRTSKHRALGLVPRRPNHWK